MPLKSRVLVVSVVVSLLAGCALFRAPGAPPLPPEYRDQDSLNSWYPGASLRNGEDGLAVVDFVPDSDTRIPIVLNADGMPLAHSAFNDQRFKEAGVGEDTRLFQFRGRTYIETRAHDDSDGGPSHEIWALTASGHTVMCQFIPVQYRAVDMR